MSDGLLHLYECVRLLRPKREKRCGHISRHPGVCPYDHGEDVELVPLSALCLCGSCGTPVEREDSRAEDGQLICSECVLNEIERATK
jgi:superfamily II helicase